MELKFWVWKVKWKVESGIVSDLGGGERLTTESARI